MKGDNLTLECETASQRPPEYIWSFEGEELSNTSNVTVGEVTGQLNVTNVTFLNTGTYNCFAENNFGNDTQNSTVVVAGEIVCVCVCVCVSTSVCVCVLEKLIGII